MIYQVLVIWCHIHLKKSFRDSHITSLWFVLVILFLPGEVASVTLSTNARWITLLIETLLYHWKHRHREQMQEHTHAPPFPKSEVCRPDWKKCYFIGLSLFKHFKGRLFDPLIHICVNLLMNYYKYSIIFPSIHDIVNDHSKASYYFSFKFSQFANCCTSSNRDGPKGPPIKPSSHWQF